MRHFKFSVRPRSSSFPIIIFTVAVFALALLLSACAPTPSDQDISAAIREALLQEDEAQDLDFHRLIVSARSSGKALAVIWNEDESLQRNYVLRYSVEQKKFVVERVRSNFRREDGSYAALPSDPELKMTEAALFFDFPDPTNGSYLLIHAGSSASEEVGSLRERFEQEDLKKVLTNFSAKWPLVDLGGDDLVLVVPQYVGMEFRLQAAKWKAADHVENGEELARFGDQPFYLFCKLGDKHPVFELHCSFQNQHSFLLGLSKDNAAFLR